MGYGFKEGEDKQKEPLLSWKQLKESISKNKEADGFDIIKDMISGADLECFFDPGKGDDEAHSMMFVGNYQPDGEYEYLLAHAQKAIQENLAKIGKNNGLLLRIQSHCAVGDGFVTLLRRAFPFLVIQSVGQAEKTESDKDTIKIMVVRR